jgi:ML domain
MFKFVALTVLLALSGANAFFSRCADHPNAVFPRDIQSPSCTADRCTVARGETLRADAFFTPVRAHNRLDVVVTAYVLGVGVNLPVPPPSDNACNSMFRGGVLVGCPTVPGVEHMWRIDYVIPSTIPAFPNARVRCKY